MHRESAGRRRVAVVSAQSTAADEFRVDVGRGGTWQPASVHPTLPDALDAYDVYRAQLSDTSGGWRHLRIVRNGTHVMIRWDLGRP
jgi:hypothetical protein